MKKAKPLVGISAVSKLLKRNACVETPESELALAVIVQALADLTKGPQSADHQDAKMFFLDGRVELWCDLIDLNAGFVREVILKTRYLAHVE